MHVKTIAKRLGRGLKAIWEWCKQHRHDAVNEQQKTLNAELRCDYQYYGRRTNYRRYSAVLPESPLHLAGMAEPPDTWKAADVGEVCRNPTSVPAATTSDHTCPKGGSGESRRTNPLREICTVGSVRGEIPDEPWWT